MALVEKIGKIDAKFADALKNSKDLRKFFQTSPWAWFSTELFRLKFAEKSLIAGLTRIKMVNVLETYFGFRSPDAIVNNLVAKGELNPQIVKTQYLIYLSINQALARVVMEYFCLNDGQRPDWADNLVKAKNTEEVRLAFSTAKNPPRPVLNHTDFYNQVLKPLKPWLTESGKKTFTAWKKEYHKWRM